MRQNSTLKKMNSYLCVIDTLKLRTRFLIMRHTITRARARSVYVRTCDRDRRYVYVGLYVHKYKVYIYPVVAAAAEMATATADDVYVHQIQCCIRGYLCIQADLVPD